MDEQHRRRRKKNNSSKRSNPTTGNSRDDLKLRKKRQKADLKNEAHARAMDKRNTPKARERKAKAKAERTLADVKNQRMHGTVRTLGTTALAPRTASSLINPGKEAVFGTVDDSSNVGSNNSSGGTTDPTLPNSPPTNETRRY